MKFDNILTRVYLFIQRFYQILINLLQLYYNYEYKFVKI